MRLGCAGAPHLTYCTNIHPGESWEDMRTAISRFVPSRLEKWRIHFHVPVFLETLGPFGNTQPFFRELLTILKEQPVTEHLEVETYTWDVLPEEHRREAIDEAIAREISWVCGRLAP